MESKVRFGSDGMIHMILWCHVSSNSYSPAKGVGIVNGMEILQAFPVEEGIEGGLEKFRQWLEGFDEPSNDTASPSKYLPRQIKFHNKHKSARSRWIAPADFPSQAIINAYLKPAVDKSKAKFSWGKPDLEGLETFCAETLRSAPTPRPMSR